MVASFLLLRRADVVAVVHLGPLSGDLFLVVEKMEAKHGRRWVITDLAARLPGS